MNNIKQLFTLFSLISLSLGLTGCSLVPNALQVPEGTPLVSYQTVQQQGVFQGDVARWGGAIVKVENKAESSLVEIMYFPLNHYARPQKKNESPGRFRVEVNGFIDPVLYAEGRFVTVVGNITGTEQGKIGEFDYLYPILSASQVYLWQEIKKIRIDNYDPWMGGYWGYPYPYRYGGFRRTTIIVEP